MIIDNMYVNTTCEELVTELQHQLTEKHINYLQKTKDSGNNIQVQCPYHSNGQERRPSAGIRKEDGLFHCFACNITHTLPEVISNCFGYNDSGRFGHRWIVRNFVTGQVEEGRNVKINVERNNTSNKNNILDSVNCSKSVPAVTEEELDSYRYYHPYWTKRGITEDWLIELFDLGYDIKTNCITFPVRDINGKCVFVARRSVETKWFNYPKDVEKPLYGLYEADLVYNFDVNNYPDKLYITESMIDCILLWQADKCAVALNGLGSEGQIAVLNQLPVRHYVLATDNDKAGNTARQRLKNHIKNKLITEVQFPKEIKDIGECTKEELLHIEEWEVF